MSFNFDEVVLAEGALLDREDRDWCLVIGCGAQSSLRHGTDTQQLPVGREAPLDFHAGIRTSDDLLALQVALRDLSEAVAERLAEILPPPHSGAPSTDA